MGVSAGDRWINAKFHEQQMAKIKAQLKVANECLAIVLGSK
jgi:hypothetical protein